MPNTQSPQDVLVLLSLLGVMPSCGGGVATGPVESSSSTTTETQATSSTPTTTAANETSTAASEVTGNSDTASSSSGDPSPTSTTSIRTDGSDETGQPGDGTGGMDCPPFPDPPAIEEPCAAYVAVLDVCSGGPPLSPACLAFEEALCQADLEAYEDLSGVECRMAFEDAYACVGALDCRELEAGQCSEFVAVIERACS